MLFPRLLTYSKEDTLRTGRLEIRSIQEISDHRWACLWSLENVAPEITTYGADSLEALTNALRVIRELIRLPGIPGLKIWWQFEGDEGGLLEIAARTTEGTTAP